MIIQVIKAFDHKTQETVAIKMIRNKKRFHTQAMIEMKILRDIQTWDPTDAHNVVRMHGYFKFRNHLCKLNYLTSGIIFELLSMNLYEFIKCNEFRGFSIGLIKRYISR